MKAFLALPLFVATLAAQAAVTCGVSLTSVSTMFDPTATGNTAATGSFTVSCTRLSGDPSTFSWSLGADNGQQPSGQLNRAVLSGAYYTYDLYKGTPYSGANRWRDNNAGARISGTVNFGSQLTGTASGSFDVMLTGPQTVQAAGTYTDLVTATLRDASNSAVLSQSTFSVLVITSPSCTLGTPPGSINFAYTSFQVSAASASTNFAVTCTTGVPYTMSLDASSGTLLGLPYTLALSQASGSGSGSAQTYSISGSIVGGLPGICSTATCSASDIRTLTITY